MKKIIWSIVVLMVLTAGCKQTDSADPSNTKETKADKKDQASNVNYIIGYDIGSNMKKSRMDTDLDALLDGIKDALAEKESKISKEDQSKIMQQFSEDMRKKQEMIAEENKAEGEKFLEKNKDKKGIVTLDSGLQYKVIKEGNGEIPKSSDMVKTNYTGKLLNGTVFDSTEERGEPATFPVNGVIQGWQEALQLMKVGSKWELYVPYQLAYGERGAGEKIGPNSTLVFEIELLSIEEKPQQNNQMNLFQ